jgi:hypothetical protein
MFKDCCLVPFPKPEIPQLLCFAAPVLASWFLSHNKYSLPQPLATVCLLSVSVHHWLLLAAFRPIHHLNSWNLKSGPVILPWGTPQRKHHLLPFLYHGHVMIISHSWTKNIHLIVPSHVHHTIILQWASLPATTILPFTIWVHTQTHINLEHSKFYHTNHRITPVVNF